MNKKKTLIAVLLAMVLCIALLPMTVLAFNAEGYRAKITSVSAGAPITGLDGKKYIPVTVVFSADEDLGDKNAVEFLEGYLRATLTDGRKTEGIAGVGMTLMPVSGDPENNQYNWQWKEGEGKGILKYNVPYLENGETQTVETSQATGQIEVNGVKDGDKITLQIETVMDPAMQVGSLFSNEETITIGGGGEKTYTLTVNFTGPEGFPAPSPVVQSGKKEGDSYRVIVPEVDGYIPEKEVVSGTMPAKDVTETVNYKKIYQVKINYVFPREVGGYNKQVSETWKLADGEAYSFDSDKIVSEEYGGGGPGTYVNAEHKTAFVPDKKVVEGTINGADVEETVTYTCIHPAYYRTAYNNNDDKTHNVTCNACKEVVSEAEPHKLGEATFVPAEELPASIAKEYPNGAYRSICTDCNGRIYKAPEKYSVKSVNGAGEDASHTWTKGSGKDLEITVKKEQEPDDSFSHYLNTKIDGKNVAADARDGSTIVTIKSTVLEQLSVGKHTITVCFDNGEAEVALTVLAGKTTPEKENKTPQTGDGNTPALWAVLALVALGGIAATVLYTRRRHE